jgi:outer membrane protein OmpA-like peptidoglycan-associated protein
MSTIQNVQNERISAPTGRLSAAIRGVGKSFGKSFGWILAGAVLVTSANGCLATRGWVQDQMNPLQAKLNDTDAKADQALAGLNNLHLERKLVLDSSNGPTFAFGSSALTPDTKREIDGFVDDLQGTDHESAAGRVYVIAGYTDDIGKEDYNYQLAQRRAQGVAGYLIGKEGVDPMQVRVVSYGASHPIASNSTSRGRRSNRRVEILVYQEKISSKG